MALWGAEHTLFCVVEGPGAPRCDVDVVTSCRYDGDDDIGERLRKRHYRSQASWTLGDDGAFVSTVTQQSKSNDADFRCQIAPQRRQLW